MHKDIRNTFNNEIEFSAQVAPLNLLLITRDRNFLDIVTSDRFFWSDGFKCKWVHNLSGLLYSSDTYFIF